MGPIGTQAGRLMGTCVAWPQIVQVPRVNCDLMANKQVLRSVTRQAFCQRRECKPSPQLMPVVNALEVNSQVETFMNINGIMSKSAEQFLLPKRKGGRVNKTTILSVRDSWPKHGAQQSCQTKENESVIQK